ncbi:MAG: flagellar basal body P-ring formation chaperone FlgA [Pseudomonadota bacterium]
MLHHTQILVSLFWLTLVNTVVNVTDANENAERAEAKLATWLKTHDYTDYQLTLVSPTSSTENRTIESFVAIDYQQPRRRMKVTGRYHDDKGRVRKQHFWFDTQVFIEALVSTRHLQAGEALQQKDFTTQRLQMLDRMHLPLTELPQSSHLPFRLQSTKAAGSLVYQKDLTQKRVIAVHDRVKLLWHDGPISISTQGIALEQGMTGDTIEVMPYKGTASLLAIVQPSGELKIVE